MTFLRIPALLILFVPGSIALRGQGNETLVYEKQQHVRHFSGKVVDARGMTVQYATVELHDPKTHRLLASTFADANGYFVFDDKKYGKRIELRAFQKGFNVSQYIVVRKPFGDLHIRLVLTVAN